jgi:AcrR family transcriptional regulator
MPATRRHLDRDAKRGEIVDAAEALMLRDGYQATSVAAIARDAGVANSAVYWYFAGKDEILAAVLGQRLEHGTRELSEAAADDVLERILALLAQLDKVACLTAAVHERAQHSAAVAEMHLAFHRAAERMLSDGFLKAGLTQTDAGRASEAVIALVDGIHLHGDGRDPESRDSIVSWTVQGLLEGCRQSSLFPAR